VTAGPTRPVAVLVGPPGSGKTVTGRALAGLLGVPFEDTDEAIVRAQGRSIADLFVDDGEAAFRALERAEVARALAGQRGVVSLGGGAPVDPATQALLAGHRVVFLDVGIADAARRIGFDRSLPTSPRCWTRRSWTRRSWTGRSWTRRSWTRRSWNSPRVGPRQRRSPRAGGRRVGRRRAGRKARRSERPEHHRRG